MSPDYWCHRRYVGCVIHLYIPLSRAARSQTATLDLLVTAMPAADGGPTRNADAGIGWRFIAAGASAEKRALEVTVVLFISPQLVPGVFQLSRNAIWRVAKRVTLSGDL